MQLPSSFGVSNRALIIHTNDSKSICPVDILMAVSVQVCSTNVLPSRQRIGSYPITAAAFKPGTAKSSRATTPHSPYSVLVVSDLGSL